MSFAVSHTHIVELPEDGAKLAFISDGDVFIWPGGVGAGPMISMSLEDWARINKEVRLAMVRAGKTDERR